MTALFVDSSVVVAVAFGEPGAESATRRLRAAERVFASALLEAELRSACAREGRPVDAGLLAPVSWVHPDRSLGGEIERVLAVAYLRGADCWHLATALYAAPNPREVAFLTLDKTQRSVARRLGFRT